MSKYGSLGLFIGGRWIETSEGGGEEVVDPSTGETIATLPHASEGEIDAAAEAARAAFPAWRARTALERSRILRRAAQILRERLDVYASHITIEQGKPIAEARVELLVSAETFDWYAEEGRRAYGRIVPAPQPGHELRVLKQPVGPVAAFTPWNFPAMMPARKVAAALAAGCTVVLKPAEETPAGALAIARALEEAELPPGVLNVIFGDPAAVSSRLIAHPAIRKITFTGSVPVGQLLARQAAEAGGKRCTMELGGHAPVLILEDADLDRAVSVLSASKYRNAGQVCISPTRFFVHDSLHDRFVEGMVTAAGNLRVGSGLDQATTMGPLANSRRVSAMQSFIDDATGCGGRVVAGGERLANRGNFFAPTVIADVPDHARVMNEEPFGPIAVTSRVNSIDEAIEKANRLPFGLASYAFTRSASSIARLSEEVEAGMLGINTVAVSTPEAPFGGVKDSGYGSEGGIEGMDPYLATKLVSQA
jgi:succinate-semialdehyde dehydrogenase/glutarate-semialdehyde dehydrogenase